MGSSSQQTNSSQNSNSAFQNQSQFAPYQPSQAEVSALLTQLNAYPLAPTGAQNSAVGALGSAARGLTASNLGGQAQGAVNNIGGLPSWLQGIYGQTQKNLAPLTNTKNLNPYNTPGFSDAVNYAMQQAKNNIAGEFAGSGRSLSPADVTAQAYGMTGAVAPTIAAQYNANVNNALNANSNVFNAGATTAGFGLNANTGAAGILSQIPGLATAGPTAQLQAAQTGFGLPFSNIGTSEGMVLPIAGLGGQTSGTGTGQTNQTGQSNTTYNPSLLSMFGGIFGGGANGPLAGATKLFGF